MASISKITRPLLSQICSKPLPSSHAPNPLSLLKIRSVHTSVYDKNFDEQIRMSFVPDDVVQPLSEKYWAPHPQTGVFGPQSEQSVAAGGTQYTAAADASKSSVMEQKAWFRHTSLEDLEKHHPHLP